MKKFLVANRSLIASAFLKSLKKMGKESFLISSIEEINYHSSYLTDNLILVDAHHSRILDNKELLIDKALENKVEAIIPGYGFQAQNSSFARLCEENSIVFAGPESSKLNTVSDRKKVKDIISELDIEVVPYSDYIEKVEQLEVFSKNYKFPFLLKPANSWGSHLIDEVKSSSEIQGKYDSFKRRLKLTNFFSEQFIAEKLIKKVREIEIPFSVDSFGDIQLYSPVENTVQKHRKKVMYISPPPFLNKSIINELKNYARTILNKLKISGVGSIEFFIDNDSKIYFNEINPTIPFSYPVVEEKNSISLRENLIRIIEKQKIPPKKKKNKIVLGLNIYAEDVEVRESKAVLEKIDFFPEEDSYLLSSYFSGEKVSLLYEPLMATLITYEDSFKKVQKNALENLNSIIISGVGTNINDLIYLLKNKVFSSRKINIDEIEKMFDDSADILKTEDVALISAYLFHQQNRGKSFYGRSNFVKENFIKRISRKIFGG